jgi:hypothetical protein
MEIKAKQKPFDLLILNYQGKVIMTLEQISTSSVIMLPAHTPAGMYFIKILSDKGTAVYKVCKSN